MHDCCSFYNLPNPDVAQMRAAGNSATSCDCPALPFKTAPEVARIVHTMAVIRVGHLPAQEHEENVGILGLKEIVDAHDETIATIS